MSDCQVGVGHIESVYTLGIGEQYDSGLALVFCPVSGFEKLRKKKSMMQIKCVLSLAPEIKEVARFVDKGVKFRHALGFITFAFLLKVKESID